MMSRDPIRKIESSVSNASGFIDALIEPKSTFGYTLALPEQTPFTHGIILFRVTSTCNIIFSPETEYKCRIYSITEIITKDYELPLWGLKMISDNEAKEMGKMLFKDFEEKGIKFPYELETTKYEEQAEKYLKIELDRFNQSIGG